MAPPPDPDLARAAVPDAADRPRITVMDATTTEQLDAVRGLMRAFVAWHRERHVDDLRLIDGYFDGAAFDAEVAGLAGKYGRPEGRLLLALVDGRPAGCVALRSLGDGSSEMKRMFVDPEFRGRGVGKALAVRLIDKGRWLAINPCGSIPAFGSSRRSACMSASASSGLARTTSCPPSWL